MKKKKLNHDAELTTCGKFRTRWFGPAYDVTAVRACACISLRPEALFGKTHVSYSLPPLTAQLFTSDRNCSLWYEMGKFAHRAFVFCLKYNRKIPTLK